MFDDEPIRGLPEMLPAGERILWQGSPRWQSFALHAFHTRAVAVYCGIFLAMRVGSDIVSGAPLGQAALTGLWLLLTSGFLVGLVTFLGWVYARSTVYTVTNQRVAIRSGAALPMILNIPFAKIGSAGLRMHGDDTGDILLELTGEDRIAYLQLWPNARPWRIGRPQPLLRAVSEPGHLADVLAGALASADPAKRAKHASQPTRRQPLAAAA